MVIFALQAAHMHVAQLLPQHETGQKLYIEKMKESRPDFFQLNTLVTIENGLVTEINRRWIPIL